jgi:hypothetical protein
VTKKVTGLDSGSANVPANTTFTLTGMDIVTRGVVYNKSVHYSDFSEGNYVFEELPEGNYTLTENGAEIGGYTLQTSFSPGSNLQITGGAHAAITVTNAYTGTEEPTPTPTPPPSPPPAPTPPTGQSPLLPLIALLLAGFGVCVLCARRLPEN